MGKTGKAVMFMIYTVAVLIVGGYAGVIYPGWERYQQASQAVAQNTAKGCRFMENTSAMHSKRRNRNQIWMCIINQK